MNTHAQNMLNLLQANPQMTLAYEQSQSGTPEIIALVHPSAHLGSLRVPRDMPHANIRERLHPPMSILVAPAITTDASNVHQRCQDEPVKMGTQIQPVGANWVGTGGAPIDYEEEPGTRKIGFLTNWHVIAMGNETLGRGVHQPTTERPPIGRLHKFSPVRPSGTNYIDAAIANAMIDGYHTIDREILELGDLSAPERPLQTGDRVYKSGRTTGRTTGMVLATGAAARVGYGDFEAVFADQDVIEDTQGNFSAAGDSGSLIVCQCDRQGRTESFEPGALLFAGGGNITIGNPERHLTTAFHINWRF